MKKSARAHTEKKQMLKLFIEYNAQQPVWIVKNYSNEWAAVVVYAQTRSETLNKYTGRKASSGSNNNNNNDIKLEVMIMNHARWAAPLFTTWWTVVSAHRQM